MQNENFTPSKQNLFFELSKHNIILFILLVEYHPLTANQLLETARDLISKIQKLALIILKIELKIASIRLKTMSLHRTTHIQNAYQAK